MLRALWSVPFFTLLGHASLTAQTSPPDAATLAVRIGQSVEAMQAAVARAKVGTQAVRASVPGLPDRIAEDMAEIDAKLALGDLGVCLGQWAISSDRVEQLPAADRPAARRAMQALVVDLRAAFTAQGGKEALEELAERLGQLEASAANGERMDTPLGNLADTLSRVELAEALPRAEIVALRVHLASIRDAYAARLADDLLEKAKLDFAELEAAMPELRQAFAGSDDTRSSAHARFTDLQGSILQALSRVPESNADAQTIRSSLAKLTAERVAAYEKAYGDTIHAAVLENYELTAGQFAGWEQEAEAVATTAADYVGLDGAHFSVFNLPRTAACVDRSNLSIAHVGMQEDALLCAGHPGLTAFAATVRQNRALALDRLCKHADALVTELEGRPIEEDRVRDRLQLLADWDLRVALQEDPRQWALLARLHRLIDAYDRRTLGEQEALTKTRQEAATTAEANWTRMGQRVPAIGGFQATQAGLWQGKLVRVEGRHDCSASFEPGDHDLVLDIDGHYFAAKFDPELAKVLAAQLARVQTKLTPQDTLEIHMLVGGESTRKFRPPASGERSVVACRKVTVMGLRFGPVAVVVR